MMTNGYNNNNSNKTRRAEEVPPLPISSPRSSMCFTNSSNEERKKSLTQRMNSTSCDNDSNNNNYHYKPVSFPRKSLATEVKEDDERNVVVRLSDAEKYWLPPGSLYFRPSLTESDFDDADQEEESSAINKLFASLEENIQGDLAASPLSPSPQERQQQGRVSAAGASGAYQCGILLDRKATSPATSTARKIRFEEFQTKSCRGRIETIIDDVPAVEEPQTMILASRGATREIHRRGSSLAHR